MTMEVREKLVVDAEKAVILLNKLTTPVINSRTEQPDMVPMPKAVLMASKAVAIVWQQKMGAGIGISVGSGFVISKLQRKKWSAPCYLKLKNVSAGVTLGYKMRSFVICIKDAAALQKLVEFELELGVDAMLQLGLRSAIARDVPATLSPADISVEDVWRAAGASLMTFSLADIAGMDFSLKGGIMHVDAAVNKALFGQAATPEALLSGEVQAPPEMEMLYETLNEIQAEVW